MEHCEVLNLTLNNPTSEKVTANILDSRKENSQTTRLEDVKNGKIFNTTQGAGSGDQLSSIPLGGSGYNSITNIYYVSLFLSDAIWVYDVENDVGSLINSSTVILGDSYPLTSNPLFLCIDETHNSIIVGVSGTSNGLWIYNIGTNTGKLYTSSGGVSSGDEIPGSADVVAYDHVNNICWAAGTNFLWKLEIGTNTGENVTIVTSGDNYPSGVGSPKAILYDSDNNLIWVSRSNPNGIYKYNPANDSGKIYNTSGGAGNGDQLPSNFTYYQLTKKNNNLYVPTGSGIWIYNISTDTGSIINTGTSFNGDALPNNSILSCLYSSVTNKLYVGSSSSLWVLDMSTNTGEIISVVASGENRPSAQAWKFDYVDGVLWELQAIKGVWKYHEYNIITEDIASNNTGDTVDYDYVLNSINYAPIKVNKIVFYSSNSLQKTNNIRQVVNTMFGDSVERQIQPLDFEDPNQVDNKIHIIFDEPVLIGPEEFFQMDLEALTVVDMIFYYCQDIDEEFMGGFVENFEQETIPEETEIIEQEVKKSVISCAVKPFFLLLIIYLVYRFFKKK